LRAQDPEAYEKLICVPSLPPFSIPSLSSISVSVVSSLITRHALPASRLRALPDSVFAALCDELAHNSLYGYRALERLKKENSDLGRRIPISVWLDSCHSSEQHTRNITFVCSLSPLSSLLPPLSTSLLSLSLALRY